MELIKVLIIDDEIDALEAMRMGLANDRQLQIITASARNEAINIIKLQDIDIIITDLKLKDGSGIDIINFVQENFPRISIIVVTAYGSIDTAIKAIRSGAYEFLQKPIRLADLKRLIIRISETILLKRENERLKEKLIEKADKPQLIGNSTKFREILELIKQVAPAQSTILITGESGTGKEVIASAIHYYSNRKTKPIVNINCGAIPENLIEAELFGYEKGAFTGAHKQKKGKIEVAHEGTLFLDEIGELSKSMQVKLLRVLQNGELEHLGGNTTIKVNVRIIAATNADLQNMVKTGLFREDLFYRLNVISIHIPPLRERPDDIVYLAQHFIEKYNKINNKNVQGLESDIVKKMKSYYWKGNIRELENMIERAVVLSNEKILKSYHFPALYHSIEEADPDLKIESGMTLAEIEKRAIQKILQFYNYDKNKTAMSLQIGLATLDRKMKEYQLD